ncbi:hypothetical protein [Streptomyces omiyaensis]|uniref:Uncharacterized protein n=1 Tax=Streptomyces omiyaensis TaxID=68247 RepID=A0ABW7C4Y5_9ACTN|nr:hypothetical protein [Streptomyces omiyaensis]GGY77121.1 hypothetical protein GCM10010363_67660 [Streptomyces omiyaensis]
MSASENSERNQFPWAGPWAVPDYPDLARDYPDLVRSDDPDVEERHPPGSPGELRLLPAPFAEKARAAAYAARGAGSGLWSGARAHRAATGGAVAGAAAALALAHVWGRRAGRRAARRGLGPVALLLARRP